MSLTGVQACAQLREIDPAKLPADQLVQNAYANVRTVESMVRDWSPKWTHDTPKEQVVALLTATLADLQSSMPQTEELLLFRGLVAHFAYNVDVQSAWDVAVRSFEKASELNPTDYRPGWFLAEHRCQSNDIKAGMEQMLAIENRTAWQELPVDFWDDYSSCSTMSLMPAHTLRAVDHAVHLGRDAAQYNSLVAMAQKRYKSTDAKTTYAAREAWQATQGKDDVQFISQSCGLGFSAHGDWKVDIKDMSKGTCLEVLETGPYPSKSGQSSPTLLLLTRPPKAGETLEDFTHSFVQRYPSAGAIKAPSCPSTECLAFEIVTNTMYQSEGGAHLLVVAFTGRPPEFPGLLFEKPETPPKDGSNDKVTYYHPNERLQRLPGVLYTVVELDSNASIFEKASADFRYLLASVQVD